MVRRRQQQRRGGRRGPSRRREVAVDARPAAATAASDIDPRTGLDRATLAEMRLASTIRLDAVRLNTGGDRVRVCIQGHDGDWWRVWGKGPDGEWRHISPWSWTRRAPGKPEEAA